MKKLKLLAITFFVIAFSEITNAANVSWTNVAGGNWSSGINWSNLVGPGPNDTAVITLNGTYTVTMDVNITIQKIVLGGNTGRQTLTASSRTIDISKGALINDKGIFYPIASTITGNNPITNNGRIDLAYNNTFNINITNNDTIDVQYYGNYFNNTFNANAGSLLKFSSTSYYSILYVANGFTNSGTIEFNSVTNYSCDLIITAGTLINAGSGIIISTGIYNPAKTITGNLTNNGTMTLNQDLNLGTTGHAFINNGNIAIASTKRLTNSNNSFTHSGGNITGLGDMYFTSSTVTFSATGVAGTLNMNFNNSTVNFNTANTPGKYLEFYGCTVNSTQPTLTNAKKIRLIYNNTVNANVFNTDTILASHQYNTFAGTFSTSASSRIFLDGNTYYTMLTFTNGFTNNGRIELNSITNYGLDLYITNGVLINAAGATIISTGIYNPAKTITGSVTNNGSVILDQDLNFAGSGATFLNNATITLASGKRLTNTGNTFTYAGGTTTGTGDFYFSGATANFNANGIPNTISMNIYNTTANFNQANIPGKYLEFYGAIVNSTQATLTNARKLRFVYNNTVNANIFNTDTIIASHQYNTFAGNFTTSGASRIFLDGNSYYTMLTFTNGFTNNGQIEFNSLTNYGLDLYITNGVLLNAAGAFIKSTGIYNPAKSISGSVTNNGTVLLDQDLTFQGGVAKVFLNNNTINIAAGKTLTNSSNTFTYAGGNTPGTGNFVFNSAIANFNVSAMPGKYLEFNQSTLNSTFLPITNARKLRFNYNNTINAAVFNTDTIYISHYYNYMLGALTTSGASRIIFDCLSYYGQLTVSKGFTNNGKIIFNSVTGYYGALTLDSNLIINTAGGEIWSTGLAEPNYIYAGVNNSGLITCDKSLIIQKVDSSTNTGAINIAATKYLKFYTGKLKFNGGTASGPGKLVFESATYEENLASIPNLLTEFTTSNLVSNAALINNYGTLQFYNQNTITANVKNKTTGVIKVSHYLNSFNGNFTNEVGSLLSFDCANYHCDMTFANGFTNNGTIDLRSITGYYSTLSITAGELLNNTNGVIHSYEPSGYRYLYAQLNNKGSLNVEKDLYINKAGAVHQNVAGGTVTIASANTLTYQNGTLNLTGGTITGAGFLAFETSTYNVGLANFPLVYHKFTTSKIEAAAVVGNATTLHFYYQDSIKASINNKSGGVMRFSHYINVMTGQLTTTANSLLSLDCGNYHTDLTIKNGFLNKGLIELKSITGYYPTLTVEGTGIVNDTNATIDVLPTSGYRYYNGILQNNGTFNMGYDNLYVNSSSFVNTSVGLLKGAGNIYMTGTQLVNDGVIAPGSSPGILSVGSGNTKLSNISKLNIEIGGPTAGTQHDQFNAYGIDSISGILNVTLINGFIPALGDSFIVSNYGTRVGTFSNVTGNIPGGLAWNIFYRPTYVVIRAGNPSGVQITATAGPNGTITPSGVVNLTYNGSQTFTMTPNANYQIDSVIVDGVYVGKNATYSFTNVVVNHTISVKFKTNSYTINASKTGNGVISPTGAVSVAQGANQNFTFTPNNSCNVIDSIIVDGVYIGAPSSYNFTNVQANHTIKAVFKNTLASSSSNTAVAVCAGDSISVSGANGFTSYLWSNGKTTQSIYIKTAGNYTVTVTGTSGCTIAATYSLTVNPLPSPTFTNPYATANSHVCYTDGGVTLNSYGNPAGGSFSGNGVTYNGFGYYAFTPSIAGYGNSTLTYFYTDVNGCSKSVNRTLTVDTNATVYAGADQIKCGNLTVPLTGTKGGSATSVTWTTNGTGSFSNANALSPTYTLSSADATNGSVTLTITTNNPAGECGAVSDQMVITYYQDAVADAGSNTPVCVSSPVGVNGSITGYPLATPLWTSTGTGSFANANALQTTYTASAADITAGNVKLILKPIDPNGSCTFSGDTLWIYFDKYAVDAGPSQVLCGTSVATMAATKSTSVTTVTWSSNGTGSFSNANSLTSNYTLSTADKNAGGVTLTVTTNDPAGPCGPESAQMSVAYRAATADAGPIEVCGDTIWQVNGSYTATPGTTVAPVWSTLGSGTFNNTNIFNPVYTASASDKTAGSVRLVLKLNDATGVCNNFVNDTIKVWFNPYYTVNAGVDTIFTCADKQVQLAGSRTKATSSIWSTSGTGTFTNVNSLTPKYNLGNADTTAHKVTLYLTSNDPAGPCGTVVDSIIIITYSVPKATAGTNSPVCIGTNLNITGSGANNYIWSGPNGYSSTLQNIIRTNADTSMAGVYTVTVTNSNGCSKTVSTTATIVQCGCIPPVILTGKTDALCFGSSNGTASTTVNNVAGPFTYLWSNGQTTKDASGLAAGVYTVTVSTGPSCSATASVTIGQPTALNLTSVINNTTCGYSNGSVQVIASGGTASYNFLWNTVPAQSTSVISSVLPGSYTCTVTDVNGCTKSITSLVVNNGSAITNYTIAQKRPCYADNNGKLTVKNIVGGNLPFTYLWNNGATTSQISGLVPGSYTVTVTDASGCSLIKSSNLVQRSQIVCNVTVNNATCGLANGSAFAAPTGGKAPYRYSWNTIPSVKDSFITNVTAGIYTLTVTDTLNCKSICVVTILDNGPVITVDSVTNIKCNGSVTGAVRISATSGLAPYAYLWSNGKTTKNNINVSGGTYTVTVTDANGCSKTASASIVEPAAVGVTISTTTTAASANQSGGVTPFTFLWSNGKTTKTIGSLTAGTIYTVTVTDANLCTKTASVLFTGLRVGTVEELINISEIQLYPNPASDLINVDFNANVETEIIYQLFDAFGRMVIQQKANSVAGKNNQTIALNNLADGIYELKICSENKFVSKRLVIKK